MKKKRKKYQTVQPTPKPAPEPEKAIPINEDSVHEGNLVKREPITFSDNDKKDAGWMVGRVVWIHPLGRFHVVEFGEGRRAVRESFLGVAR